MSDFQDNLAHTADKDSNPPSSNIASSSSTSTSTSTSISSSVTTDMFERSMQLQLDINSTIYQTDDNWIRQTDTPFPSPPYVHTPSSTMFPYLLSVPMPVVPNYDCSPPYIPSYLRSRVNEMLENNEVSSVNFPTGWNRNSKYIKVFDNGLRIMYIGPGGSIWTDAAAIRTNCFIPREVGFYYYEVTLLDKGSRGNIGLGLKNELNPPDRMPGWDYHSIGYHGDDGLFFTNSTEGADYGPLYTTGDTVGCGINFFDNSVFFTKNGINLGNAIENCALYGPLYPTVGLISKNECVEANFGARPFEYDIMIHAKMVFQEAKSLGKKVKPEYITCLRDLL